MEVALASFSLNMYYENIDIICTQGFRLDSKENFLPMRGFKLGKRAQGRLVAAFPT